MAGRTLREFQKDGQARAWSWNTELLSFDVDPSSKEITVPDSCLAFEVDLISGMAGSWSAASGLRQAQPHLQGRQRHHDHAADSQRGVYGVGMRARSFQSLDHDSPARVFHPCAGF